MLRALRGPEGDELRTLLGRELAGDDWTRALKLVRSGDGIGDAVTEARNYVAEAEDASAPFAGRPAAPALAGAASNLLDGLTTLLA